MAEQIKTTLFELKINNTDLIQKQAALTREVEKQKEIMSKTKKTVGEASVEYQKQKVELGNLQREYKNTNNILQINDRIAKSQTGSYEQLLNVTKKMEIELKLMANTSGEGTAEFKKLQTQVAQNREKLIGFGEVISDGRLNVGNYKQALRELQAQLVNLKPGTAEFDAAAKKAGELKDQINDAKDATKAFASSSKTQTAKTLFSQVGNDIRDLDFQGAAEKARTFGGVIKSISFKEVSGGLKDLGGTLLNVGKAILANPFALLAGGIVAAGFAIRDLWNDFKLGDKFLKNTANLMDDVKDSIKDLRSEVVNLQIDNKVLTGELSQTAADKLKAENDFTAKFIENRKIIADKEKEARDEAKKAIGDISQTSKLLGQAGKVEITINAALSKKLIEIKKDAAEEEKLLQQKLFENLKGQNLANANEITADLKDKLEKEADIKIKAGEKAEKLNEKITGDTLKTVQELEDLKLLISKKGAELQIAQLQITATREKAQRKGDADFILAIEKKLALDIQAVKDDANVTARAKSKAIGEGYQAELDADAKQANIDSLARLEGELINLQTAGESEIAKKIELENEKFRVATEGTKLTKDEQFRIESEHNARIADLHQQEIDEALKVEQAKLQVATSIVSSLGNLSDIFAKDASDNAGFMKALAVFQIAIDTAKALVSGIAASQDIPYPGNLVAMASTIAIVLANVASAKKLLTAEPPKAEKGIILGGKPHSGGGTIISADGQPIAEAERGELLTIVNKKSTGMLQGLSALNQMGGGIPFMEKGGAGKLPEFQTGGFGEINKFSMENNLSEALKNMPQPVVIVQDIAESLGNLADVKNRANV